MLSTKLSSNETVILKLVSGEEIIARYKSETDSKLTIEKAFSVNLQISPSGQQGLGLAPALMISDPMTQSLEIEKHAIAIMAKPPAGHPIVAEYQKQTSGIMTVSGLPGLQG
jgi:hypothetical protein